MSDHVLHIAQLKEGMVVSSHVYCPQKNELLLKQGTRLNQKLISLLRARNIENVHIKDRFTVLVTPDETVKAELIRLFDLEIDKLVPNSVEANTNDNMMTVLPQAKKTVRRLVEDPSVLNFCVRMKIISSQGLFMHCVRSSALSLLTAGALGKDEAFMYQVSMAALLHDIGLCEIPHIFGAKKISEAGDLAYREHPKYGYYLAKEAGVDQEVTLMILHHHEFWDGSGYPNGLKEENIPFGSRIISVCETYDRLIYQEEYPRHHAIEYLYGSGNYYFDSRIVNAFVNNMAVYPLGTMVRLSTGEVGIVVNVRKNLGPRPVVRVYFNRVNMPIANPKDIDLGIELTVFIKEVLLSL